MERRIDPGPVPIKGVDPRFLAARGIVAIGETEGRVVVGMPDPDDAETVAALAFALRRPVVARPVETAAGFGVAPAGDRPSLFGRLAAMLDGAGVARWVAVDAVAQLVARGATVAEAVARVRGAAPDAVLDRIAAGHAPEDWAAALAVPGREVVMLTQVAGRMRFEVERATVIRQACLLPGLVLVAGLVLVGIWGVLPSILLPLARRGLRPLAVARATGRAMAVRAVLGTGPMVPHDGLTAAERDRWIDAPEAVLRAVDARALLAMSAMGTALAVPMLLILAVLAILRLG